MSRFLRTVPSRHLLAMITGAIAVIAAGTTIAVAAAGGGPVPLPKSLPVAIHDALAAPTVQGITARISFTNHLIDSSEIEGANPILTGATGRLWLAPKHRLRLELQSDGGDAQVVLDGRSFWVYDPASNTVYQGTLPAQRGTHSKRAASEQIPSVAQIQSDLKRVMQHLNVSGAIPGDVAGRPVYTVRVSPKDNGGLIGAAELAWDALRGVPLRIAVYARGSSQPVLELKATDITYGPVPESDFAISPPSAAKVVKVSAASERGRATAARGHRRHAAITGAQAVARHLPFTLDAPRSLVGLRRQSVTLLDWGSHPAALIVYGRGLGGIAVVEQAARQANAQTQNGDRRGGLNLPTVSINGTTAQQLQTALGTLVRFTRRGISYIVVGSVPAARADAAARGL